MILALVALLIGFNSWDFIYGRIFEKYVRGAAVSTTVNLANVAPTIGEVSVYGTGETTVTLTEDSAIDIMASASIADGNGCTDIRDGGGVEAIFYTSDQNWTFGVSGTPSLDYNNVIDNTITSCSYQSCAGTTATYECVASSAWYYYADATIGVQASKVDEAWEVMVWASDSAAAYISSTSFGTTTSNQAEINLLSAMTLAVNSQSIPYDNTAADSDSTVLERGIRNSGNRGINPLIIETTVLTSNGDTILAQSQQFAAGSFTIGTNGTSLSTSNQELDMALPQRTDPAGPTTASVSDDRLFWGLHVPLGTPAGNYSGSNTYTATPD